MTSFMRFMGGSLIAMYGLSACGGDFSPPSKIDKPRPLGAAVSVVGDPGRAWAKPGETVEVRWLWATPFIPVTLNWTQVACRRAPADVGLDFCADAPFAMASGDMPSDALSPFTFVVPEVDAAQASDQLVVLSAFCQRGSATVDGSTAQVSCVDGGETLAAAQASFAMTVQLGTVTNYNPNFADNMLSFMGDAWAPLAQMPDATGCANLPASPDLPHYSLRAGNGVLKLQIDDTDRETFSDPQGVEHVESLLVSHYTTLGSMERQYSAIDLDDPRADLAVTVSWKMPDADEVDETGSVVRFYFFARDDRGGFGWTMRYACLTR